MSFIRFNRRFLFSALILAAAFFLYFAYGPFLSPHQQTRTGQDSELIRDTPNSSLAEPNTTGSTEPLTEKAVVKTGAEKSNNNSENTETSSDVPEHLTLFGIVTDDSGLPIEDVLVSEELHFTDTRTDADGQYRISVELPEYKYPVLNFLRSGFEERRISLTNTDLKTEGDIEINIALRENVDTITFSGWIGARSGEGLDGQKIRLSSRGNKGIENIYYGLRSDENGGFSFEGIRSDLTYKLETYSTARFSRHVIEEIRITRNTPYLRIILDPLNYIDTIGMIADTQGNPVPGFTFNISNLSTDAHYRMVTSDSSGFFNLQNFPEGKIMLTTSPPEYFKVTGLTLSGNDYRGLVIPIDKGNYYLSGWVRDENGVAVENARIRLVTEIMEGDVRSYSNRSKITDSTGGFYFDNVGGVSHSLSVYADGFAVQELAHSFRSAIETLSITLHRK